MKQFLTALLLAGSSLALAEPIDQLVVFGDSLSDNGNLYEYMRHQLPPSPPYYQGRFSNGPVWVEVLSRHYFPQDKDGHMLNYAFGGAGVTFEASKSLMTLQAQVDAYLLSHEKASPSGLYVVWIGANNYLTIPTDVEGAVSTVNRGIYQELSRLADAGAKNFLILNLPNLGQTPMAREFHTQDSLTIFSDRHNAVLAENIEKLQNAYPAKKWLYFDINESFTNLINHPAPYGLSNVTDSCYHSLLFEMSSSSSVLRNMSNVQPTRAQLAACDEYLFFDLVHPTRRVHDIVAQQTEDFLTAAGMEG